METIESLLEQGNIIRVRPQGYSMYPFIRPGRDQVVLKKVSPRALKRGDVVLYQRAGGMLVLHRIWKRKKDGFYLVGDNQIAVEGPVNAEQIKGQMIVFCRNGRYISAKNPYYFLLTRLWLILRPFRQKISAFVSFLKKHPLSIC